ncbi:hypothetical protein DNTS_029314 [Danionella cerebrum]|uniref:Uncharacterized protein n=1 Tax=Danionella cerebrum TaxID=2873325 RepID=A0A553R2I1_9TELE|nr:hypothetical protein DNTS_029314 [Danionella translucida]
MQSEEGERRCGWCFILCFLLILITTIIGYIHFKREQMNKMASELEFSEAAVREAAVGVNNYAFVIEKVQKELDDAETELKELQGEVEKLNPEKDQKDKELQAWAFAGEKASWTEALNIQRKLLQETSPACAYVKEKSRQEPSLLDLCPHLETLVKTQQQI